MMPAWLDYLSAIAFGAALMLFGVFLFGVARIIGRIIRRGE